ncbi:MAG: RNA-binding protein [Opitutaceae bacterium]|nr:RNA-binding protein [Cytophagales bacterium]
MDIFVGSLPFKLKDSELKELFEKHGEVTSAKIIIDKETRQNKGFGFVEMPKDEEALNAIKALDGMEVMGRMIKVNKSEKREPGSSGPRSEAPRRPAFNRDNSSGGGSSSGSGGGGYSGGGGSSFNRDSSGGGGSSFNRNSGGGGGSNFRGGSGGGGGGSFNKDSGRGGGGFKGGPDKNKEAKSGGGFNKGGGKGTGIPKKRRDDEDED